MQIDINIIVVVGGVVAVIIIFVVVLVVVLVVVDAVVFRCCCCCCWSGILSHILLLHSLIQCYNVTLIQAMYIYSCHGNYLLS